MIRHHNLIENGCTRLALTSDSVAILSSEILGDAVMHEKQVA